MLQNFSKVVSALDVADEPLGLGRERRSAVADDGVEVDRRKNETGQNNQNVSRHFCFFFTLTISVLGKSLSSLQNRHHRRNKRRFRRQLIDTGQRRRLRRWVGSRSNPFRLCPIVAASLKKSFQQKFRLKW